MVALGEDAPLRMSADEFFAWPGDGTPGKVALVDGEVVAMAPASVTHGQIQAALAFLITDALRRSGSACTVATEAAVIPRMRARDNVRIPDLAVTCSPVPAGARAIPDPVLIIEILSPGNAAVTRSQVWAYTTIPTVREIVLVQSARIGAEILRRGADGAWPADAEPIGPEGILRLDTVELAIPLRDVYAATTLGDAASTSAPLNP